MKAILILILAVLCPLATSSEEEYKIDQLQGAWWSDYGNATADFSIQGNEVWLDFDARFHPCEIKENILIFHVNDETGSIKNKIISISGDRLELENLSTRHEKIYTRGK